MGLFSRLFRKDKKQAEQTRITTNTIQVIVSREKAMIFDLPQMNNAIREVANAMGVGMIEFDKDGITFENCTSEGYITDSATTPTHPNEKGHTQMAKKAVADMQSYITSL